MQVYSVSEFVQGVNELLSNIPATVEGEVSNFHIAQNRFVWFDLKDADSVVSCFMLSFQLQMPLEDGMQVQVIGSPGLFKKSGKFHLRAQKVQVVGEGGLKRQYELLKAKLEQEGLFDTTRKRTLPKFPQRIGIVTSQDAAAFTDVKRVLQNRWPGLDITLFHVQVQGDAAPGSLLQAFNTINRNFADALDVVIITRGGGSLEDLQAFNDEAVVRAVYGLKVPTIVGVGHERDETLVEFVADVRASTPSNAAEFAVPHQRDVLYQIQQLVKTSEQSLHQAVRDQAWQVQRSVSVLEQFVRERSQSIQQLQQQFRLATAQWHYTIQEQLQRVSHAKTLLESLHPARILARGYSITTNAAGQVITSVKQAKSGTTLHTKVADGEIESTIQ